jgi:DNA repair protein SbcD/Mre11
MTIAITADLHLTSRAEHPQRFAALEDILIQMLDCGAHTLIIAGDLFDENRRDFHEFEEIIARQDFRSLHVVIIPGNHDATLKQSSFSSPQLLIIDQPRLAQLEERELPFLFLPYKPGVSAGDHLAAFREKTSPLEFIMVSHGDYLSGVRTPNPLERGIYMPLARMDLDSYQPARVFLGHTHIPFEINRVVSPGSPAAIDPTETGRRSFLIYDALKNSLERRYIQKGPIHLREKFTVMPSDDDFANLQEEMRQRIDIWNLTENELARVQLQVIFSGCSRNRAALHQKVLQELKGIRVFPDGEPDLADVLSEDDPALAAAAALALQKVEGLSLSNTSTNPEQAEIQRAVFRLVYGD